MFEPHRASIRRNRASITINFIIAHFCDALIIPKALGLTLRNETVVAEVVVRKRKRVVVTVRDGFKAV